jgi:hypothetical protein
LIGSDFCFPGRDDAHADIEKTGNIIFALVALGGIDGDRRFWAGSALPRRRHHAGH